jgi:hypothetical protein
MALPLLAWWCWGWRGVLYTLLFEFVPVLIRYVLLPPVRDHFVDGLQTLLMLLLPSCAIAAGLLLTVLLAISRHFWNRYFSERKREETIG